jgi:hypothetical protein
LWINGGGVPEHVEETGRSEFLRVEGVSRALTLAMVSCNQRLENVMLHKDV